MSQELHYTSVARGLSPGSRGFGTVATTAGLAGAMADRLEALSVYRAVYPPGDPSEPLNPVAYVHARLSAGGPVEDVLSRIGPAGLDYSGRPNKYAHHVILSPDERPEGGPAWLLAQPGFIRDAWEGEPRILEAGVKVPRGDRAAGIAEAWRSLTGDAGWAGALAGSFLEDPRRPVFLIFRPGMELLPLFVEAIALLPASRRWDVEFSTYLTTLPPGVSCFWRGVLEGSPELKAARRLPNALILDLRRPLGQAAGGVLVHLARTGERLQVPDAPPSANGPARPPAMTAGPPPRPHRSGSGRSSDDDRDWLPDLAARLADDESLLGGEAIRRPRRRPWIVPAVITGCLVAIAATVLLSPGLRRAIGLGTPRVAVADRGQPRVAAPPKEVAATPEVPIEIVTPPAPSVPEELAVPVAAKRDVPSARGPVQPILLAFAPPEVPRSTLGVAAPLERTIPMPEETADRVEIRNGSGFRLSKVAGVPHAWDVATRTGSGLGGGVTIARLSHADARAWRFEWTKNARARSSPVEGFKDAILEFEGRDGRPIRVLLRGVPIDQPSPLEVWKDQRLLFDKLDARTKSVAWAGDPDPVEGSHWKLRILRWKLALTAAGDAPGSAIVREGDGVAPESGDATDPETDLVPGEIRLKLAIDPEKPGTINVRIDPDPDKVVTGRDDRAVRLGELKDATPHGKDGAARDPLEFRRGRLGKLRKDAGLHQDEIEHLQKEIADLEKIAAIQRTENLLGGRSRAELSVVVGLDVDGPGILEIVRTGDFARGR